MTSEEKREEIHKVLRYVWGRFISADEGLEEIEAALRSVEAEKEPEWISCDDRMPTEHDYDMDGKVWIRGVADNGEEYIERVTENEGPKFVEGDTHWMPTGFRRPAPPEHKPE